MGSDAVPSLSPPLAIDPALEREYALRARHPERGAVYERFAAASAAFREGNGAFEALRYGDSPNSRRRLPARRRRRPRAPLRLHPRRLLARPDRSIFTFLAQPWLERGVHVALPGYDLAPALRVGAIAAQVEAAVGSLRRAPRR